MSTVLESGMYISLNKESDTIIKNDIELFRTNADAPDNKYKFTVNKFLNNVFVNMYDGRIFDREAVVKTRNKGAKGVNIKPNKTIMEKMEAAGLVINYDPVNDPVSADFAAFYVQLITEYCQKTRIERERIFYKQLINDLNDEIELKYLLKLKKNDGWDTYIFPYSIEKSDDVHKSYLTGFALRLTDKGYVYKKTLCVPLSKILGYQRIEKIRPEKQIFFEETPEIQSYADMKNYIEERFYTDGVLYLSDILRNVTVRLTDNGKEFFLSRTQHRPVYEFDKNDDHLVHCRATQLQTFMYFFKFGGDAEVLEPEDYRKYFIRKYENALNNYHYTPKNI